MGGKWEKKTIYLRTLLGKKVREFQMIWKVPGIKKSISVDQPVSLIDIFPTLIDICNLQGNYKFNIKWRKYGRIF